VEVRRSELNKERIILVSNRLPVTVERKHDSISCLKSSGGLVSAMGPLHEQRGGLWFGWPGIFFENHKQRSTAYRHLSKHGFRPIWLTDEQETDYYQGFSNSVLWPLFHYLVNNVRVEETYWVAYRDVNRMFARSIIRHYKPGDVIWIHDYHLMLLPRMIRSARPDASIGFFLHTPFPSSELFRVLPWRRELLEGILGADLVGFHTYDYVRHFRVSVRRVLNIEPEEDVFIVEGRGVRVGVFPIGIEVERYRDAAAHNESTRNEIETFKEELKDRRLILGVDRLDYTKGIPERLLGYERFLELNPDYHEKLELLQVGVPSRTEVRSYRELRENVEQIVGRVNGRFGSARWTPIKYIYRPIPFPRLCALYRYADIGFITPLRDGMNLVSKEFVACQTDSKGVLIISEFAGAAAELPEAIHVNPYDTEALADSLKTALSLTARERKRRMSALFRRVKRSHVTQWRERFLRDLKMASSNRTIFYPPRLEGTLYAHLLREWRQARFRFLGLDYDGTLRPFVNRPEHARPPQSLRSLLRDMTRFPDLEVAIISGRDRGSLERWFGRYELALIAEHGRWIKVRGGNWEDVLKGETPPWRDRVRTIMEEIVQETPGSMVELKSASVAFHYRTANQELGRKNAQVLAERFQSMNLIPVPDILYGNKVLEVRVKGVSKASALVGLLGRLPAIEFLLVAGDDQTDEDMFSQLPPTAWSIHVGSKQSSARFSLDSPRTFRTVLRRLMKTDIRSSTL